MSAETARQLDHKSSRCVSRQLPSHDEGGTSSKKKIKNYSRTGFEMNVNMSGPAQDTLEQCSRRSRAGGTSVRERYGEMGEIGDEEGTGGQLRRTSG